jgi:hypothetical protein
VRRGLLIAGLVIALFVVSDFSGGRGSRAIRSMHSRLDRSYSKRLAEVARLEKTGKIRSAEQHDRELARRCIADSDWIFKPVYDSFHQGFPRGVWAQHVSAQKDAELSAAFKRHESRN